MVIGECQTCFFPIIYSRRLNKICIWVHLGFHAHFEPLKSRNKLGILRGILRGVALVMCPSANKSYILRRYIYLRFRDIST